MTETSSNQTPLTHTPPVRLDVLCLMWNKVQWINQTLNDANTQYDAVHRSKMFDLQTLFSGCKTILSGLKDEELELRVIALEEKLKDGVLIERSK